MNIKTFALASAFVMASTAAASAACSEPIPPAPINGKTATLEQMQAASKEVKAFIADSDNFQNCVNAETTAARLEAAKSKKEFNNAIAEAADARITANQKMKQKVGDEFNAAVGDYRTAHPAPAKP